MRLQKYKELSEASLEEPELNQSSRLNLIIDNFHFTSICVFKYKSVFGDTTAESTSMIRLDGNGTVRFWRNETQHSALIWNSTL